MGQHDYNVANAPGATVRADINNVLDAIVTLNSGNDPPDTMFPYMLWADTTNGLFKQRNGANNAWITIGLLAGFKLDDWKEPDDNTDLDVSIAKHGLCPKAPNDTDQVLRGDGSWDYDRVVQIVNYQTGAVASGVPGIPYDDTIPQNDEGTQFMTLAITPKDAANILHIDVTICLAQSAAGRVCVALFQDATASALACAGQYQGTNDNFVIHFRHRMVAGTDVETTFKVRAGGTDGTTTFNGVDLARKYGGVLASSITIVETIP